MNHQNQSFTIQKVDRLARKVQEKLNIILKRNICTCTESIYEAIFNEIEKPQCEGMKH